MTRVRVLLLTAAVVASAAMAVAGPAILAGIRATGVNRSLD
jgi:hypothetical protein